MHATPEQRVNGRRLQLLAQGYSEADATRLAHEIEGVPIAAPRAPTSPSEADDDAIEALHWQHSCEMRRADAATRRAALAQREILRLRRVLASVDAEAARLAEAAGIDRLSADMLLAAARSADAHADEQRAFRLARRRSG